MTTKTTKTAAAPMTWADILAADPAVQAASRELEAASQSLAEDPAAPAARWPTDRDSWPELVSMLGGALRWRLAAQAVMQATMVAAVREARRHPAAADHVNATVDLVAQFDRVAADGLQLVKLLAGGGTFRLLTADHAVLTVRGRDAGAGFVRIDLRRQPWDGAGTLWQYRAEAFGDCPDRAPRRMLAAGATGKAFGFAESVMTGFGAAAKLAGWIAA